MRTDLKLLTCRMIFAALAGAAGCAGTALDSRVQVEAVIDSWSNPSALAARRLMEEYGTPDEIDSDKLVWRDNGPWRRTTVWNVTPPYVKGDGLELMEQTVYYPTSEAQASAIGAFSDRVFTDKSRDELSVRTDREELSCLSLNLADDIAQGRLTPAAARWNYDKLLELESSGKSSPYMAGLLFSFGR